MDPATMSLAALALKFIAPAVASSLVGGAVNAATPKTGMSQPGQIPQMQGMDIDSLLAKPKQAQSQLPRLTLS